MARKVYVSSPLNASQKGHTMRAFAKRAALLCLTALLTTGASAQIVGNGSFETFTGVFGGDGGAQLTPVSSTLTGWSIVGGEIAVLKSPNSYNLTASDGSNFLDLAGYGNNGFPKGISQSLSGLTPGANYAFSMDLGILNGACVSGGNNCHGPITASVDIGGATHSFTHDSALPGNDWGHFGFSFVAPGSTVALTILGTSIPSGNQYLGLDNVAVVPGVSAVPEPATAALMLAGLAAVGMAGRRRRG